MLHCDYSSVVLPHINFFFFSNKEKDSETSAFNTDGQTKTLFYERLWGVEIPFPKNIIFSCLKSA